MKSVNSETDMDTGLHYILSEFNTSFKSLSIFFIVPIIQCHALKMRVLPTVLLFPLSPWLEKMYHNET